MNTKLERDVIRIIQKNDFKQEKNLILKKNRTFRYFNKLKKIFYWNNIKDIKK